MKAFDFFPVQFEITCVRAVTTSLKPVAKPLSSIVATKTETEVRKFLPIVNEGAANDGDTRIREETLYATARRGALLRRSILGDLASAVVKTNISVGEDSWFACLVPAVTGGHLDEPVEGAAVFNPRITALLVQGHIQLGKVTNRIIFVSVSVSITVIPVVFWVTVVSVFRIVVELDSLTGSLVDCLIEVVVLHIPLVPHQAHQLQLPSLEEADKKKEERRG